MLSVIPREMEEIRASQSKMLDREEKLEKRKPSTSLQLLVVRGLPRRPRLRGGDDKKIKEDAKSNTKEGNVKDENKYQVKPSVVLDNKGLDVDVPVTSGNVIDFQSLQGLTSIHFHFQNK